MNAPAPSLEPAGLPENAFRELAPGEGYAPVVPSAAAPPEVTLRSVLQGVGWAVIFSAAATYIALKLGQGIESAIPIAILAVGASALLARAARSRRPSSLLENVNVLAVGATSGIIAGGSVFTMPAVFILGLEGRSSFFQIMLVPLLGAFLGVFFLAPFRRYFTRDLHGKLPFPEARATTEILVAGNRGGQSALVLTWSAGVAAVFDFVGPSMKGWADTFSTGAIGGLSAFTERTKAVFTMNTSAAIFGLGYIMGLDYAAIILAGSMVSFFALIPLFGWLGPHVAGAVAPATAPLASLGADQIFRLYVQPIGVGGIFAAGVLSILKMSPVIGRAARQALGEVLRLARGGAAVGEERTDRSLPMAAILAGIAATGLAIFLYFRFSVLAGEPRATFTAAVAVLLTLGISFLFTAVSAWAIAMISITPVSGMTLTTLIVTAVALSAMGLSGQSGMIQTLLIGGVVCTALSMSGSLVTQYKIGYWLGATPRRIEVSNLLGSVVASAATTAVIFLMARVYGFSPGPAHLNPLPAPQPNAMAAVLRGVMGAGGAPWFLYAVGAVFAVATELCGVSGLAFALGMYLPMDLNSPLVVGAGVAWLLRRSSKDAALAGARHEKGTLIASGFIAGGALVGVLAALLRFLEDQLHRPLIPDLTRTAGIGPFLQGWGNWLGLGAFLALTVWVYGVSRRAAPEPPAGAEAQPR